MYYVDGFKAGVRVSRSYGYVSLDTALAQARILRLQYSRVTYTVVYLP